MIKFSKKLLKILFIISIILTAKASFASDFTETRAAAEKGDIRAQYRLGVFYRNGSNLSKEQAESGRLYRISCEKSPNRTCILSEAMAVVQEGESKHERDNWLFSLSTSQSRAGFINEAIKTASLIDTTVFYSLSLNEIAIAQSRSGLTKEALETGRELEGLSREKGGGLDGNTIGFISGSLAKSGDMARALKIIRKISDERRPYALYTFAESLSESGLFEKAIEIARSIENPLIRVYGLSAVAANNGDRGLLYESTKAVGLMKKGDQSSAFRSIARAQAKLGLFNESFTTISKIDEAWYRPFAMFDIIVAQSNSGLIDEAFVTYRKIIGTFSSDSDVKSELGLGQIAIAQAKAGLIDEALVTARKIKSAPTRASALGTIAAAFPD